MRSRQIKNIHALLGRIVVQGWEIFLYQHLFWQPVL